MQRVNRCVYDAALGLESLDATVGRWVVDAVVQAAALLAIHGLTHDDVAGVDHVAKLADVHVDLRAKEELLSLLVDDVEAGPSALQAEVRADDAHVGLHDLLHFGLRVGNEVELLVWHGAGVDPVGDVLAEGELLDARDAMLGSEVGIDYGLDQGVRSQTVAAMEAGA